MNSGSDRPPFGQQLRGQALPRAEQALKDLAVGMGQKKLRDLLVIRLDVLNQRQQLGASIKRDLVLM